MQTPTPKNMTSNYIHEPFKWLNVDKVQEDSIGFCFDLGLNEYSLAMSIPLEAAIAALLGDRPDMPSLCSSKLPKIDRVVLNDPSKLRTMVGEVTPMSKGDVTPEQLATYKAKTQGVFNLDIYKTAYKSKAEPELNIFDSCNYCIDPVDLQALQLLVKIDDFYSGFKSGVSQQVVLCEFGLIYLFYAALGQVNSGLEAKSLVDHVLNISQQTHTLKGGERNSQNYDNELQYIKSLAIGVVSTSKYVPWKSVNFAVDQTIESVRALLEINPIPARKAKGAKPSSELSPARYRKVILLIQKDQSDLFL